MKLNLFDNRDKKKKKKKKKGLVSIVSKGIYERKWNDQLTENDRCLYFRFDSNNLLYSTNEEKKKSWGVCFEELIIRRYDTKEMIA